QKTFEYHVIPENTQPIDFEVHTMLSVHGHSSDSDQEQEFLPFYSRSDLTKETDKGAYFTVRRLPRMLSEKQKRTGDRTTYVGSEVYVSLVDAQEAPYGANLRQLSVRAL